MDIAFAYAGGGGTAIAALAAGGCKGLVAPGTRYFGGMVPPNVHLALKADAGQVYFLRFFVRGTLRAGAFYARLHPLSVDEGRNLVAQAQLFP